MGSAFLCAEARISPAVIENQVAYVAGWLSKLREDRKLLVYAAAQAQKAADFILGRNSQMIKKLALGKLNTRMYL